MKTLVILFAVATSLAVPALAGKSGRPSRPDEEPWPKQCSQTIAAASRVENGVVRPEVLSRNEPLPDLRKWHLRCGDMAMPAFELLVSASGSVTCARTVRLDGRPHPREFFDEIRKNLRAWTFTPARRDGAAIPVIFPVTIAYRCN